jgi:hypothetical protein
MYGNYDESFGGDKMNRFKIICVCSFLLLCFGCTREDQNFIGTWSNKNANGGDLKLIISRDGEKLLVKDILISSGQVIGMQSARVENGYLVVDGDGIGALLRKVSYSETEDALIPESVPAFHRVK